MERTTLFQTTQLLGSNLLSGGSRQVLDRGLRDGANGRKTSILLRVKDGDGIGQGNLGSALAFGIVRQHDADADTQDTLAHQHVANGSVNIVLAGLARVDHQAVHKLHRLGTLAAQLTGDDNLGTTGTALHNEADDTVAGTAHRQTRQQLELDGLALGDSRQTTVLHLLSEQLNRALSKLEALLDDGSELADAAAILAQDVLGLGGADHNLGALGSDADLDTRVPILRQKAGQQFVQLGVENTVSNKLKE